LILMSLYDTADGMAAAAARVRALVVTRDLEALARELAQINESRDVYWPDGAGFDLLKPVLDMHTYDVIELIHLLARHAGESAADSASSPSFLHLFERLAKPLPDDVLPMVCDDWLAVAADQERYVDEDQTVRMARARLASGLPLSGGSIAAIRRTASIPHYGGGDLVEFAATLDLPVLNPGEAWSDAALADAAQRGQAWLDLLAHARTASSAAPSARWEKNALARLAAVGEQAATELIRSWLARFGQRRTLVLREYLSSGANDLVDDFNANALRGLAWMLALACGNAESARSLAELAVAALRKVPGSGPRNPKVANAAVYALSRMPGEDALAQLGRLATRITYRGTLTQLEKALDARAAGLGLTRAQVEELAVPDFGLTQVGRRMEQFGDVTAGLGVRGRAVDLTWHTAAGKVVKSPPAAVRRDFPDEVKELKSAVADIEKMLAAQSGRLERIFLTQRTWSFTRWREYYLDHPLVGTVARRLIWIIGDVPAGYAAEALRTVDGAPLTPAPDTPVTLWHPVGRETAEVLAWRDWLEQHQVTQPFKQAHREIYPLTPAERSTGTYSNRFAAHILRQHQFNALAAQRGWRNRLRLMVDDNYPPATRELPEWGLRAEFWVEGLGADYRTDATEAGAFLHVTTDQVRFYPAGSAGNFAHAYGGGYTRQGGGDVQADGPIPLADVPPLVLSEILRDVDLFVGVASLGNDPAWQDGGPGDRYREYWRSYAFGELSETARTRADLLRRLLPRLRIADRCTIEGRFLHVRGTLRSYKIHLGSGNILMSPDDSYLCIVPGRSADPLSGVFLPFESDQTLGLIVSKAFLLANDSEITDPSISRQIR
jgi:hypothetical protein